MSERMAVLMREGRAVCREDEAAVVIRYTVFNARFFAQIAFHFVILRYSEGSLVICAEGARSFGVPQDDKFGHVIAELAVSIREIIGRHCFDITSSSAPELP